MILWNNKVLKYDFNELLFIVFVIYKNGNENKI